LSVALGPIGYATKRCVACPIRTIGAPLKKGRARVLTPHHLAAPDRSALVGAHLLAQRRMTAVGANF
ncbi:MAG: hypothetical protein VX107_06455, partial [Pseudomonadota bacterium]|nr:hypothetical protein [Pseudomonadota bacterium]